MAKSYTWNPEDYARNSSAQQSWAEEIILGINLQGNEQILDIGCGDGKNTAYIADCVPGGQVLGIDNSAAMVALAKKRFPRDTYKNLDFMITDAREIDYEAKFDLVVSFACLHWIGDHQSVLSRIKNSLKPGGRVFMQFGGKGNADDFMGIIAELIMNDEWKEFFNNFQFPYHFYDPLEYMPWVEEAGLKVRRVELVAKDMLQKDRAGFMGWFRTTFLPYIERIPNDLQDAFINEAVDLYLAKYPPASDGTIKLAMVRLEVEAIHL